MRTSNSAIQTFKACRRLYELKYIYGLEPVQPAEVLERGISYHEGVEMLLKEWVDYHEGTPSIKISDPKIRAMVFAFNLYVIPKLCQYKIKPVATEEWFTYKTKSGHLIVGRADGRMSGNTLVEHKTTSGTIDGSYFIRLDFDEQIPTYMIAFHSNKMYYTVCQTPTIRQRKNESDDDFFNRCVEWYEENTDSKISVIEIHRTQEDLERFKEEQDAIVNEMADCKLFYRNPSNCTKWGRMCEYASVCMDYDPNKDYIQFKRREDYYEKAGKAEVLEVGGEQADSAASPNEAVDR